MPWWRADRLPPARAFEYDRVYAERADLRELLTAIHDLLIAGDVLELACGTGQWTRTMAARARRVTALDSASEVLGIVRARAASPTVEFVQADVLARKPPRQRVNNSLRSSAGSTTEGNIAS